MGLMSYLYEHGPLRLHHHLQQRFNQSLRCSWDQVEKVDDGRTDLHLLQKENRDDKALDEMFGKLAELDMDSFLMDSHCGKTWMNIKMSAGTIRYKTSTGTYAHEFLE